MFTKAFLRRIIIRTLKVDILTLFLALNIIVFSFVISFSYFGTYQSIMDYSKGRIERNSQAIVDQVEFLGLDAEKTLIDTEGLFALTPNISPSNKPLIEYMEKVVKFSSHLSEFFVGTPSGAFIGIMNLSLMKQRHYIHDSNKLLPQGSSYLVRMVEPNQLHNQEIWYYVDKDFNILGQEIFDKAIMKVSLRPWYQPSINMNHLYWTNIYYQSVTMTPLISAAKPIVTREGKLVAVSGADLSLAALSDFLLKNKISKNGQEFIINQKGDVIVPNGQQPFNSGIDAETLNTAYKTFNKNKEKSFVFTSNRVKYLAYINSLPVNFGKDWFIAVIVPFSDFFSGLLETQIKISAFTFLLWLISAFAILWFSKRISTPIVTLSKEIDKIKRLELDSTVRVHSHIVEIILMNKSITSMRAALRSFERYVPKQIVKQLLKRGKDIKLEVVKKEVTLFFSDIENFTSMAENYSPEKLMPLLSAYFDGLSKIILANQGTIDKYIGDSIMAFWGAPIELKNHAELACLTALRCQHFLKRFNKDRRDQLQPEFKTRFGINTGVVMVGNIGTLERMNYTLIGDAVNIAARLQVTDKIYHVTLIISEFVYEKIGDQFLVRPLDNIAVRGKKEIIKIYELVAAKHDGSDIAPQPKEIELCGDFTQAYHLFVEGKLIEAQQLFQNLQKRFPDDFPTQIYLERIRLCQSEA